MRAFKIKRILILGHTGFVGNHLERYFRHFSPEVEIVGRSLPDMDLTKEKEVFGLSDLLSLETAVIMCAAIKRQFGDNLDTFLQNLMMAINLSRLLEKHSVRRFIFFSSTAVYGEDVHNTDITEKTPVSPTSYYGMAKYTSERIFSKVIGQLKDCSFLILRPALIYGPSDESVTYGPAGFIKAALRKEQITLWGDGAEMREFIFIEDIVKIVYRLTFSEYDGVLNIVSGKSYSFKYAIKIISSLFPYELKLSTKERTKAKVDNEFNNAHFIHLLKDFSFTNLEEGIRKTIAAESEKLKSVN